MENNILLSRLKNAQGKFNPDIAAKEQKLIQMRNEQDMLFANASNASNASKLARPPPHQTLRTLPANGSNQKVDFNLYKIEEDRKNELRSTFMPRHESTAEYEKRSTQFNELMSIIGQDLNTSSGFVKPVQAKKNASNGTSNGTSNSTLYDMFMSS